jgi:hypothetical protein
MEHSIGRSTDIASKRAFLERLFRAHLTDLRDIFADARDKIMCPICLRQFGIEGLESKTLTDAHVWPEYIREKSAGHRAARQRVLLCGECNWTAGSRGDKQLQLLERIRGGNETGVFFGERLVRVVQGPASEPIDLRAQIRIKSQDPTEGIKGDITFAVEKGTQHFARIAPADQERFLSLVRAGERFTMMIHPYHELKAHLARVGWATSSYLLAFYTLGYRYILHEDLQPVRAYILRSFQSRGGEELEPPGADIMTVQTCDKHYFDDPEIALVMPMAGQAAHLRVSFLDYHVTLPFRGVPQLLEHFIRMKMADIEGMIPEMPGEGAHLYMPINCTKLDGHECIWDYILGKPLPL